VKLVLSAGTRASAKMSSSSSVTVDNVWTSYHQPLKTAGISELRVTPPQTLTRSESTLSTKRYCVYVFGAGSRSVIIGRLSSGIRILQLTVVGAFLPPEELEDADFRPKELGLLA